MSTAQEWIRFFTLAGIPQGIAARYASSFVSNRVSRSLLPDLDKPTLEQLGVTAVGDQLAILRRIRESGSLQQTTAKQAAPLPRQRINAPVVETLVLDDTCASTQRRGKPPPDRHEIYHVKMPEGATLQGKTAKTRKILMNAERMRRQGLLSRSTSGVRQAGRACLSIAEQREYGQEEVSSSTDRFGGLRSDRFMVQGGRVEKRNKGASGGALFSAAVAATRGRAAARRSALPQVTLRLGGRVSGGRAVQIEEEDEEEVEELVEEYEEEMQDDGDFVDEEEEEEEEEEDMLVVGPEASRVSTVMSGGGRQSIHSRVALHGRSRGGGRHSKPSVFHRITL